MRNRLLIYNVMLRDGHASSVCSGYTGIPHHGSGFYACAKESHDERVAASEIMCVRAR